MPFSTTTGDPGWWGREVSPRINQFRQYATTQTDRAALAINKELAPVRAWMRTGLPARTGVTQAWDRLFSGPGHSVGKRWARESLGLHPYSRVQRASMRARGFPASKLAHGLFARAMGVAYTGYAAYEGYKKEGVWGAVKGGSTAVGEAYIFGRFMGSAMAPLTLAAGAVYGAHAIPKWINEQSHKYREGYKGVQMGGTPVDDPFGMNATMRQRSLLAIQNSRMNARSGIGMEAVLTHRPYFR